MFGRKKKKQEEPKSYLRCPYCGHAPMIVTGKCTYPLAGCENEADADDVEGGSDCIDVRGDFTADECRIKLHDGRTVTCINFNTYKGGGGLSCDWNNASGKDGETK